MLTPLAFAGFLADARSPLHEGVAPALAALLRMSGLRITEACNVHISSLGVECGYDTLRCIGKGNRPAVVPLPLVVTRAVREAIQRREAGPCTSGPVSGVPLRDMLIPPTLGPPRSTTRPQAAPTATPPTASQAAWPA